MTSYLTLGCDAEAAIEVKHSRFLCTLRRVESDAEARDVVARLRKQHWDARHTCSAFVIGPDAALQRSSDDGEPAGTAGAPMLEVLRGAGLSDVVAVVTRWFGGTLLGAGGLVRAYGDAVRAAVERAGTTRRALVHEVAVDLSHADAGRVESELRSRGVAVLGTSYDARVRLLLGTASPAALSEVVAELTAGAATPVVVGERWVDQPPST
ncbi:YigZ family protein [Nocardioides gansuensis]|uniref:YigZ family protein n=1 Tax=Nocardioides gansuensis TaxID=2138300 RepID=A0A2T8F7L5_9ACTN|nr:YigZ family protein [Nocardioides gansuensis]PVG81711.1 YigZ family protein [Nocardioides gansuensis]